jgi:hypothetical protein
MCSLWMVSKVSDLYAHYSVHMLDQLSTRCTALSTELDDNTPEEDSDAVPRSPKHTATFSEAVGGDQKGYGKDMVSLLMYWCVLTLLNI